MKIYFVVYFVIGALWGLANAIISNRSEKYIEPNTYYWLGLVGGLAAGMLLWPLALIFGIVVGMIAKFRMKKSGGKDSMAEVIRMCGVDVEDVDRDLK